MNRDVLGALGSKDHVIGGLLFPVLPDWLAEQVAREKVAAAREFAKVLANTPAPDVSARIAYLYGWRTRRAK